METEIVTAIISAAGGVIVAVAGYVFTKSREREADWRKDKLEYYKSFVRSINGVLEYQNTREGREEFAKSCNDLLLFAPQPVLMAMFNYLDFTKTGNQDKSMERHDRLLSELMKEIRRDLHIKPKDDWKTFHVKLWSFGRQDNAT